jgi:ribosomal protein L1
MPTAKRGTVTEDVVAAIRQAQGMLEWKGDRFGYVRAAVGRVSPLCLHAWFWTLTELNVM